jgi:hypothetical protein
MLVLPVGHPVLDTVIGVAALVVIIGTVLVGMVVLAIRG